MVDAISPALAVERRRVLLDIKWWVFDPIGPESI
jgi:hypothetical protein